MWKNKHSFCSSRHYSTHHNTNRTLQSWGTIHISLVASLTTANTLEMVFLLKGRHSVTKPRIMKLIVSLFVAVKDLVHNFNHSIHAVSLALHYMSMARYYKTLSPLIFYKMRVHHIYPYHMMNTLAEVSTAFYSAPALRCAWFRATRTSAIASK